MIKDREKRLEYQRQWYLKNKDKQKKNASRHRKANKLRNKNFIIDHKSKNSCEQCKEDDPICLEFHHRDKKTKDGNVGDLVRKGCSLDRIRKEMSKCDVLCSNCHRKEHRKDWKY